MANSFLLQQAVRMRRYGCLININPSDLNNISDPVPIIEEEERLKKEKGVVHPKKMLNFLQLKN